MPDRPWRPNRPSSVPIEGSVVRRGDDAPLGGRRITFWSVAGVLRDRPFSLWSTPAAGLGCTAGDANRPPARPLAPLGRVEGSGARYAGRLVGCSVGPGSSAEPARMPRRGPVGVPCPWRPAAGRALRSHRERAAPRVGRGQAAWFPRAVGASVGGGWTREHGGPATIVCSPRGSRHRSVDRMPCPPP